MLLNFPKKPSSLKLHRAVRPSDESSGSYVTQSPQLNGWQGLQGFAFHTPRQLSHAS